MNFKSIYKTLIEFQRTHPTFFGEAQLMQLYLMHATLQAQKQGAYEANEDILIETYKQLIAYVDKHFNAQKRENKPKTQLGKLLSDKFDKAKQTLNIEQDEEKLRNQLMTITINQNQDLYFEIQVFRWMEAYKRANPQKKLNDATRNQIYELLKHHYNYEKVWVAISTMLDETPKLFEKLQKEYDYIKAYTQKQNERLNPSQVEAQKLKSKKSVKVTIEDIDPLEMAKKKLEFQKTVLTKFGVDVNFVNDLFSITKNLAEEQKQLVRNHMIKDLKTEQKIEILFYLSVADDIARLQSAQPEHGLIPPATPRK